jgi:Cu(I)/Ag(I) efflux system membrane fusion protein
VPLKNLTLYSPITGFVMERNAFPKQRVTPETVLYTVADLSTVWVMADVFEYEAANIRLGQPATLTLAYLPGRTFHGRVSYILPQVDPATRTLKVRIEVANPGFALKPDMYGEVEFQTGGARRLVVAAIGGAEFGRPAGGVRGSRQRLLRAARGEDRRASDGRMEILSGLKAGERIVTRAIS